jgi:hypothetical protein
MLKMMSMILLHLGMKKLGVTDKSNNNDCKLAAKMVYIHASGKCLGCFIRKGMFALCGEIKHHLGRFSSSHGFSFPDRKKNTKNENIM